MRMCCWNWPIMTDPADLAVLREQMDRATLAVGDAIWQQVLAEREVEQLLENQRCADERQAALTQELLAAERQVERLKGYVQHQDGCAAAYTTEKCTCGLTAALGEAEASEKEG